MWALAGDIGSSGAEQLFALEFLTGSSCGNESLFSTPKRVIQHLTYSKASLVEAVKSQIGHDLLQPAMNPEVNQPLHRYEGCL